MLYKLIPVNGQWGSWRVSGKCSKTCGGGSQYLARNCDSPAPANGGNYCRGDHSQYKQCNTHQCLVRGANIKIIQQESGNLPDLIKTSRLTTLKKLTAQIYGNN